MLFQAHYQLLIKPLLQASGDNMNKTLIALVVMILIIGLGIGMTFRPNGSTTGQVTNMNDISGSLGAVAVDDMASHHGGGVAINNDPINTNIQTIRFDNAVGQSAPNFDLMNQNGARTKLSDYLGKTVIIFFNEGAMCYPACWNQIAALMSDPRLNTDNIVTLSIVTDTKSQWDQIISSQPKLRGATILFDTNKAVSRAYDVLNVRSSMHKGSSPGHTYFIIDPQGRVSYTLDDSNMAINNNLIATKL